MVESLLNPVFAGLTHLWVAGGFVMPWLVACAMVLWYNLGLRLLTLRRGDKRPLRALVVARRDGEKRPIKGIVDAAVAAAVRRARPAERMPATVMAEILHPLRAQLDSGRALVATLVAIAPLAGLLGTVGGMIETFRSLADMALFTQGGGIAGGIAEALLTTQMGLAVAVPGILLGKALDRRQQSLDDELRQLEELLGGTPLLQVQA